MNAGLKQLLNSRPDSETPLVREMWAKFQGASDSQLINWLIDQLAKTRKPNLTEVFSNEPFKFEGKVFQIKTFNGNPILYHENTL
jgi:hypothetical protein